MLCFEMCPRDSLTPDRHHRSRTSSLLRPRSNRPARRRPWQMLPCSRGRQCLWYLRSWWRDETPNFPQTRKWRSKWIISEGDMNVRW